jgi:uncharacterized protein (DUF1501 family)
MSMVSRRRMLELSASGATLVVAGMPRLVLAGAATERRFVFILLRGGMDGLSVVPAFGDPDFERARGGLALAPPGRADGALQLDGFFGLHPELGGLAKMYDTKQLLALHATCVAYHGRSHFEAQNVVENGSPVPYGLKTGWLNRALTGLPPRAGDAGIAITSSMPVAMRGPAQVTSWSPSVLPEPARDTVDRVAGMYTTDAALASALERARAAHDQSMSAGGGALRALTTAAGRFLTRPDGPRVAFLELGGWDTHAAQRITQGALFRNLRELDAALVALQATLGAHWNETVVAVVTEFGRTVAMNGTQGTDHGTGGVAFLLGGAVAGGRVVADWPGLSQNALLDGRDLRPTTDLRALFKAVLVDHLGIAERHVEDVVFPESKDIRPLRGLVRA